VLSWKQRRQRLSTEGVSGLRCPRSTGETQGVASTWLKKDVDQWKKDGRNWCSLNDRSLTVLLDGSKMQEDDNGQEAKREGRKVPDGS